MAPNMPQWKMILLYLFYQI